MLGFKLTDASKKGPRSRLPGRKELHIYEQIHEINILSSI